MQHSEKEPGNLIEGDGTLPIDFGDAEIRPVREVHVEGGSVVSDVAGDEYQLAEVQPHEQAGIEAAYAQARPTFERDFASRRDIPDAPRPPDQTFDQAEPNYRAGFIAGRDLRYADQTFEEIEAELHREYESSIPPERDNERTVHPQSWEQMRDEIQCGFQEARRQG